MSAKPITSDSGSAPRKGGETCDCVKGSGFSASGDAARPGAGKKGDLTDEHPERLRQATEAPSEIEEERVEGKSAFGTPTPGPARLAGSEH
ncbi:MAG: hypothetical protein JWM88_1933 [Verrucomicrobia bacterium]|nr:hypothetical protein [Verrucomicrobiota bacterium]